MTARLRNVLLLAERPGVDDDGRSISLFLDRLESQGLATQVLCFEAGGDAEDDTRVVPCPGLESRWRQSLAVRGLRLGERIVRPDLVHALQVTMSEAALAIAEHWRVPYVLTVDEFLRPGERLRLSQRWCRKLVAISRGVALELREELGIPATLVDEIHAGIDPPQDDPQRPSSRQVPVVGTAGPLVTTSGFGTFLNAAKRVFEAGVDAEFVIAGQGEDEVDLRRKADRLKIADRVTFASIPVLGPRFWSVLDVYCQPSLTPTVGRPLATAQAFGVPSVASDIEGLRTLVEQGVSGVRVPPGDSGALAAALLELLADPSKADALGKAGRALIVREYVPEVEARRLAALYDEALTVLAP
ncbi:MAG: glycosyltransferase family 4 protein [Isosphaeraceae bacterium]